MEERYKEGDIIRLPETDKVKGLLSFGVVTYRPEGCFVETPHFSIQISTKYAIFELATEEEKAEFTKATIAERDRYIKMVNLITK